MTLEPGCVTECSVLPLENKFISLNNKANVSSAKKPSKLWKCPTFKIRGT